MTTPLQSQFHSSQLLQIHLLLLLVAGASPAILIQQASAIAEAQDELPITLPGCSDKCGNISIPFPFGMNPGCFREGFQVTCNHSFQPPRAFLAYNGSGMITLETNYSEDPGNHSMVGHYNNTNLVVSPVELIDISIAKSEARASGTATSFCRVNATQGFMRNQMVILGSEMKGPFLLSATRNVLIGVGLVALPMLFKYSPLSPAKENILASCRADLQGNLQLADNGSCSGRGCCQASVPAAGGAPLFGFDFTVAATTQNTETNPCSYAMVAESSWYNFSTSDLLDGGHAGNKLFTRGVPYVIDFSIRDAAGASCPAEGQQPPLDYACVSGNSFCANVTNNGYICRCLEHYEGNPYIPNGCQDIDECKRPDLYPCSSDGICKNRPLGYDCPCKPGMKGEGKAGTCQDVFPIVAKMVVGVIGGFFVTLIMSFLIVLYKDKNKIREFYKKNGGPKLEKANMIKLLKKEDLKPILKSRNFVGKGFFCEVYKGLLDNKQVVVKKPVSASAQKSNEQFVNEVIIQSQVIHKNIVRLIGCCLEVDMPMLVYEFLPKGSLHDILHGNNKVVPLSLDVRLSIAAASADGLAYMHSKTSTKILHGYVKSANILLDDNFVPKISDFGISRLIVRENKEDNNNSIVGDKSYMDPVYLQTCFLTEKSDVYSFGVVILELISRKKATSSDNNSLVMKFLEAHKEEKRVTELFDKEIALTSDLEILHSMARIAVECLNLDVDQRPSMPEVAERLLILNRSRNPQVVCQ